MLIKLILKKILLILLAFTVVVFSIQTPCRALAAQEEKTCEAAHCCNDENDEQKESSTGKIKGGENCCVYNVLSVEAVPQFSYHQVFDLRLKTGFSNKFHSNKFSPDFWQPPRM